MRLLLVILLASAALAQSPEQRAISYLEREVNSWSRDNGCYSCHNNGDGARALYGAIDAGYQVRRAYLAATTRWLADPAAWEENKGDPGFSDKRLARIQWAYTLASAVAATEVEPASLRAAAELLVKDQTPEGSWPSDAPGTVGSPVTYGSALATAAALRTLQSADPARYADEIAAAAQWLRSLKPKNVPQAAAIAIAFENQDAATGLRFLREAQASDGGWGPYPNTPSEVFDTALAVLVLDDPELLKQGRAYLLRTQLSNGGWPETTRPSGSQSYAQHVSTTAWALLALIATDGERD